MPSRAAGVAPKEAPPSFSSSSTLSPKDMRLFTHNFLQCHVKGCDSDNYPLALSETELDRRETELNVEFIQSFLHKIEWSALLKAVQQVFAYFYST